MFSMRVRSVVPESTLAQMEGKIVRDVDISVLVRPTKDVVVQKPNGQPLAIYLPGAMRPYAQDPKIYDVLHSLRTERTDNRGYASGTPRLRRPGDGRTRTARVPSAILGSFDARYKNTYCRLTSWTGRHVEEMEVLIPALQVVGWAFAEHLPQRHQAQMREVERTQPHWLIPGTPFTTVTVNNTYPTGVHKDDGDLDQGFSTLWTVRRGSFEGGLLTFPKYRLAVDMQDGDLLLMDAHEFHGNTSIHRLSDDAERISVVSYFRAGMVECGSEQEEMMKAEARLARKAAALDAEMEEA